MSVLGLQSTFEKCFPWQERNADPTTHGSDVRRFSPPRTFLHYRKEIKKINCSCFNYLVFFSGFLVPGMPGEFEVIKSDDGIYVASWREPSVTHGEILSYNLTYGPANAEKLTRELQPALRSYEILDLRKSKCSSLHVNSIHSEPENCLWHEGIRIGQRRALLNLLQLP